jgi:hypothetical protein
MILLQWISGFMIGLEFQWEDDVFVLDLGIIRVVVLYGDKQKPA